MPKTWIIKEKKNPTDEQVQAAGSVVLASLLVNRGIDTKEKIKKFLNPNEIEPISPYAFKDMEKAVERIMLAIDKQEHILIYGDFDADGVTSTALLYKTLTELGANFTYYIPDRQTESHGLNSGVILTKISKEKVKLIITVDCAISNIEEISLAKNFKVDVIITDHHEPKDELPQAYAIINPKAPNTLTEELNVEDLTSLTSMAGVGVAFKLACALLEERKKIHLAEELLPLVALGTVADVMPLLYENRLFVVLGLKLITEGKNEGISELLKIAGINEEEEITADKLAYTVAPRINAAGRLDKAQSAFDLLISKNRAKSVILAQSLNNYNKIRQELCDKTYLEALDYIEKNNGQNDSVLIAYNPNWHVGIIGIVASKLTEKYNKPAFMFTLSSDGEKFRSSARSVAGINIFDALEVNSDIIESYGGHSMAAGLALDKNTTSIEQFKTAINSTVSEMTEGKELTPELEIDLELELAEIKMSILDEINKLEPCGEGNRYPIFAVRNLELISERTLGQNNNHLKFICSDKSANKVECVMWNKTTLNIEVGRTLDIAFYPKINEFNGIKTLQLDIQDYNSEFINEEVEKTLKVIDHRKKTNILNQVADYFRTTDKKFKVFAENKDIVKELQEQKILEENRITRLDLQEAEQLMFFDYPADDKLLKQIINTVKPDTVHFMSYKVPIADIDVLIMKVSGMMKYASTHYDGVVALPEISSALSLTDELVTLIIKLLNRTNVIKVNDYKNSKVYFEFLSPVSLDVIKTHEVYEKCRMELFKTKNFRENLLQTSDLNTLLSMIK